MADGPETLRWPTSLDRNAIVARLVQIREAASKSGLAGLNPYLLDIESMPPAGIGTKVISALNFIEGRPEYESIGRQLSMVAMNLKNLKASG